ncbi:hypothetical protein ASG43_20990 [Aureimonas sp. Leaf454]|uniref:hypothetical protein n=1 Tax=Aureimonas sp. Leaf454 TaxID=1736381 RepID=UPI0006F92577|nr:hypothetical protein [Aureimonas sp. Leaf454]KQT51969.1 hypothetical protein ASG43_20990 [Aureimonas sp. Leaf454]
MRLLAKMALALAANIAVSSVAFAQAAPPTEADVVAACKTADCTVIMAAYIASLAALTPALKDAAIASVMSTLADDPAVPAARVTAVKEIAKAEISSQDVKDNVDTVVASKEASESDDGLTETAASSG